MTFHVIPPHTQEWHAMRARHIGASEVAALFDVQPPYALSRFALHHVKAGTVQPPAVDSERIRMGIAMEPVIGRLAAERHGWTIRPGRYTEDDACPGLGASLDFEIDAPATMPEILEGCAGPGVLETKNVDGLVARKSWGGGEPPAHQLLQLQAQLACSGYEWGALAALIGGNELRIVFYRPRPRIIASIREVVARFWRDVEARKSPPADGSGGASHVLRELFPEPAYEPVDLQADNEAPALCADYLDACAAAKEAAARRDDLRNQLFDKVGEHRHAMVAGYNVGISVTAAKDERPAPPGYLIPGRAETRRLNVSERSIVA